MVATFTPLLYKHVADRRADIENINRANILLFLQQKTEEYLKDPDNVTALVDELGHNQHKEIFPSELGIGNNFDGRYIIGIRREDEENKPVLKAMIIDTVNTGSDLRAAKVAELIGISAGIYTAVDPDAAWGINGMWSEPLSRYFSTTNIPTGAVAVTTEYNKKKYRVDISDILVDSDLDLGEFELTAEQINAINLAAENGTIDQITTTDARASNKVVAGTKLCLGGEEDDKCIESWEGLGGGGDRSDLALVQLCNAGLSEICALAFMKDLNTSCSKVDAVFDRFSVEYPNPKIYNITYGSINTYEGYVRTKCEGTSFVVENISTPNLSNPVEQVGDTAFGITTPGWYQITLMGEAGYVNGSGITGGYMSTTSGAGGVLITNKQFSRDEVLIIKAIKSGDYPSYPTWSGGAGVALWDTINTTGTPALVAGGGAGVAAGGGGYNGGVTNWKNSTAGYSWTEVVGNNTTYCDSTTCNIGATGGRWSASDNSTYGGGGTGYCGSDYICMTITGGNAMWSTSTIANYPASTYGNWGTNTLTGGKAYASIIYCGTSEADCPAACSTDSDCPSDIPYCSDGACTATKSCTTSSQCTAASLPYCVENLCSDTCTADSQCPSGTPYCESGTCGTTKSCSTDSDCPSAIPYCNSGICSATCTANSQCPSNKPYCSSGTCVQCTADSQCSNTSYCSNKTCITPSAGTVMFQPSYDASHLTSSYTTPVAGRYKIVLKGGQGYQGGAGGILTAIIYYNKGTSLSVKFLSNSMGGKGVSLLVGGSVVLTAGGGGCVSVSSGSKTCHHGVPSSSRYCGTNGNQTSSNVGSGRAQGVSTGATTWWAFGGTGYCASGYSCSGSYNAGDVSATIYYCGPSSSSSCP